jgi:hypothetical protein
LSRFSRGLTVSVCKSGQPWSAIGIFLMEWTPIPLH